MSIASSIYAEYAEKKKEEWVLKLEEAWDADSWGLLYEVIQEMNAFHFEE